MSLARIVSVGTPAAPQGGSIAIGGFDTPQGGRIAITQAAPVQFPVGFPPGVAGQVVGYGPDGSVVPVNLPAVGGFPAGTEGQLIGYGPGGVPVAMDQPAPAISGTAGNAVESLPDGLFAPLNIDLGTFN